MYKCCTYLCNVLFHLMSSTLHCLYFTYLLRNYVLRYIQKTVTSNELKYKLHLNSVNILLVEDRNYANKGYSQLLAPTINIGENIKANNFTNFPSFSVHQNQSQVVYGGKYYGGYSANSWCETLYCTEDKRLCAEAASVAVLCASLELTWC